jgi:hypothetical protein
VGVVTHRHYPCRPPAPDAVVVTPRRDLPSTRCGNSATSRATERCCQMSPDERAAETVNGRVQARDQERLNLPQARSVAHLISLLPSRIVTAMANHPVRVIKTGAIPSASTGTVIAR